MKTKRVKKLTVEKRFLYWISEREEIRFRRRTKQKKPWTDDEILGNYSFCNVIRMNDRVSRWIYNNWYKPNKHDKNMLLACTIARFFNSPDTLQAIGYPKKFNVERVRQVLKNRKAKGYTIFNPAYIITGGGSNPGGRTGKNDKIDLVLDLSVNRIYKERPVIYPNSMQRSCEVMSNYWGISSFMSGQIIADARYAIRGSWKDKKTWAPSGPGSRRGMNRLHNRNIKAPLKEEKFLEELRDIMKHFSRFVGLNLKGRMEAIDWQNCLCEFDKYERALWGDGRPKRKYDGGLL